MRIVGANLPFEFLRAVSKVEPQIRPIVRWWD